MDIICSDGKFSAEVLDFYAKNGISYPLQDKMYTLREARREYGKVDSLDNLGFLLEEIKNPKVDCYHAILGNVKIEPSFSAKRFTNLMGLPLNREEVSILIKQV